MCVSGPAGTNSKPLEIMQQLVRFCAGGGAVLDPFSDSGSTGVVALREGRRFVGVELRSPDRRHDP
ncbi:hypothetical protein A6A07_30975 [Streptomyces sp. CB03911]|nr:hypothetical protein A6A07_30975 [Streptomyces sp. CB03911]